MTDVSEVPPTAEKATLLAAFNNALDCCGTCAGGVLARHVREAQAQAWDEGVAKASPHGGGYLRSLLIENPYRDPTDAVR